jgi:antitoxin (DNA-binding transcriptional repressor) of toxin-antitoxin stability system
MSKSSVKRIGMAQARLQLPQLAAQLAKAPDSVVEVTRRGKPVLHLVAPPRVESHASAAVRILQRIASMPEPRGPRRRNVAARYKDLLYGRP